VYVIESLTLVILWCSLALQVAGFIACIVGVVKDVHKAPGVVGIVIFLLWNVALPVLFYFMFRNVVF
jgi:uncharacterized membrane protein YccC